METADRGHVEAKLRGVQVRGPSGTFDLIAFVTEVKLILAEARHHQRHFDTDTACKILVTKIAQADEETVSNYGQAVSRMWADLVQASWTLKKEHRNGTVPFTATDLYFLLDGLESVSDMLMERRATSKQATIFDAGSREPAMVAVAAVIDCEERENLVFGIRSSLKNPCPTADCKGYTWADGCLCRICGIYKQGSWGCLLCNMVSPPQNTVCWFQRSGGCRGTRGQGVQFDILGEGPFQATGIVIRDAAAERGGYPTVNRPTTTYPTTTTTMVPYYPKGQGGKGGKHSSN